MTKCNQSGDFLSKIKLMSFVNIDLPFVNIDFWYPSLSYHVLQRLTLADLV